MDSDGIELADKNGATPGGGTTIAHTITAQFSTLNASESATRLKTSLTHGLSPAEAETRLRQYGPNELQHEEPEPLWLRFLGQFKEPLILLLLGSATISFFMRNFDDAISITIAVTIVVTVGFVQEYRSEKSLEALNKLVPHSSHLIRGGNFAARRTDQAEESRLMDGDKAVNEKLAISAPATQLVPGDLVIFSTGDRIPADIRITNAADLFIDESNLTGETEPVHKVSEVDHANGSYEPKTPATGTPRLVDQHNIAFMGTLVRGGHGQGIVIATGAETEFGQISASLSAIESPRTPLQQSMDRLGKDLSYMSFGVIGLIVIIGLIRGLPLLEMFQIGVSLAVAAIPEGLPIIVTVTLALGVLRMAKRGAIVRRLPSVETLGSVNVLCSDKTGTLTLNHMTVTKLWHIDSDKPVDVGKDLSASDAAVKTIIRVGNIANNSRLGGNDKTSGANSQLLSSLDASEVETLQQSRWAGQPTDVAMMDLLDKTGDHDIRERLGHRIAEVPFSSARKWMGVIHQTDQGPGSRATETAYLKGAYERVLPRCDTYISKDGREIVLDEAKKKSISQAADTLAEEGLRIIAFATGSIRERKPDVNNEDIYQGMTFVGLAGMNDPPRKGVEKSIRRLMVGGVKVIMITGDSEKTALAIASKIGMPISASTAGGQGTRNTVLRGSQLDAMSTADLASVMNSVSIFARTSPEHKMKIISALQSRGDIVAMTGDGVNDAPALKKADIGISMGVLGTDVAKEAADMILTDDNLSTILNAIEEGKGIFYNIQNFITFQLSTSVAALLLVLLSTLFRLPSPLNAMQILWINILMDGPPAQSLGVEPVDHAVMSRPPRPRTARVLTRRLLQRVGTSALIITAGTMLTYVSVMDTDGTVTARDTTMTFTCFVFFDMFNALSCRSEGKSVLRGELQVAGNKMFNYAVGGSLLGQMAVIYLPPLQRVFQTEALGLYDLLILIALTSLVFWADEARKLWRSRRRKWTSGYSRAV